MKNEEILYVPGLDISEDAGSGINERNFVKSLLDQGVNVLIPKPPHDKILAHLYEYKNLKITRWQYNAKNPISYLYHIYCQTKDIKKIVKEKNIKVVVFRLGLIPLDMLYVKKILKTKVLLKHLTYLSSSQKQNLPLKIVGKIRSYFVNNRLIDGCDTPSLMTQKHIEKYYGIKNIHIAKNGTSRNDSITNESDKNNDFIYIGRLSKARNTVALLEAFSKTKRSIDIFGFGELEKLVKDYANRYDNINFYGKVSYNELVKVLPTYKFGIDLTFVHTEFGKASYSQKIAQYLSFGMNTVAIDCPDNMFIEKYACGKLWYVEKNNLTKLIDSIEYKVFNPDEIGEYIYADNIVSKLIEFWKKQ